MSDLAIDRYELGPIGTNCYVVRAAAGASEAVVVDPGAEAELLRLELARAGARCSAILVTHGHFDHIAGVADLAEATGARVYMPAGEADRLEDPAEPPHPTWRVRPWRVDERLAGNEVLTVAGITFRTIAAPGHSPAHVVFLADGILFGGDVLFAGSVGRTDLPGGDWRTLLGSIRDLAAALPPETTVLPGHGAPTTISAELARNPFLAELRAAGHTA